MEYIFIIYKLISQFSFNLTKRFQLLILDIVTLRTCYPWRAKRFQYGSCAKELTGFYSAKYFAKLSKVNLKNKIIHRFLFSENNKIKIFCSV